MYDTNDWVLKGRLFIEGKVVLKSDLHIGADLLDLGAGREESVFGLPDNPVVRDCFGNPFIPGSTLRGNLRTAADFLYHREGLSRLAREALQRWKSEEGRPAGQDRPRSEGKNFQPPCEVEDCWVCRVFGRASNARYREPTRLRVEDAHLLDGAGDGAAVSVRTENAIHRLLQMANPRRSEYVPRGAVFGLRLVYSVYRQDDLDMGVPLVLECLHHVEDAGIGGGRNRGAGSVEFRDLSLRWKSAEDYRRGEDGKVVLSAAGVRDLLRQYPQKKGEIRW
ncbi:MAG: type III-A CRISPR-associated RAMP protein Csm3 [Bacillota bacterium]